VFLEERAPVVHQAGIIFVVRDIFIKRVEISVAWDQWNTHSYYFLSPEESEQHDSKANLT
jgi:hypothetical protein